MWPQGARPGGPRSSAPIGVVCWWVGAAVEPQSRLLTALLVVGLVAFAGLGAYLLGLRLVRRQPLPLPRRGRTRDLEPTDAALEP